MIDLNSSLNPASRPRAGRLPVRFLLAGWLAFVTPLRADNQPTYLFQIDTSAMPGGLRRIWSPLRLTHHHCEPKA
jgi:hypothetical protein